MTRMIFLSLRESERMKMCIRDSFGFFRKNVDKLTTMKTKYQKAETNVNHIVEAIEQHQVLLMKAVATLDQMYELNMTYYKELTMYILAGKKKLYQVEHVEIPCLLYTARCV